jgi:hypothetical protein
MITFIIKTHKCTKLTSKIDTQNRELKFIMTQKYKTGKIMTDGNEQVI